MFPPRIYSLSRGRIDPVNGSLTSVLSNGNTGCAVGAGGALYRMTNGSTWSARASGTTANLRGVAFADANNAFAVGDGGILVASHDGGAVWGPESSGTLRDLHAVEFLSAQRGAMAGAFGGLSRTSDAGLTWVGQGSVTSTTLGISHFLDANTGWAVDTKGAVLKTADGGASWSVAQTAHNTSLSSGFVHVFDQNTGIVGGYHTEKTTDGGATWTKALTGYQIIYDAHFFDNNTGWRVGVDFQYQNNSTTYQGIHKTVDGGLSWKNVAFGGESNTYTYLYGVDFPTSQVGIIVGYKSSASGGFMWRTSNGGASWSAMGQVSAARLKKVSFADQQVGVAVGDNGTILRTINGGLQWSTVTSSVVGGNALRDVWRGAGGVGWAIAYNKIFTTTDSGQTWTQQDPGPGYINMNSISCIDNNNAYITGYQGLVLKTTTGGSTAAP